MICNMIYSPSGYFIQVSIALVALSSLYIKFRYFETPKRTKQVWIKDVSKQIFGIIVSHVWNMVFGYILSKQFDSPIDICTIFFTNLLIDNTICLFFNCLFLTLLNKFAQQCNFIYLNSGYYVPNKKKYSWVVQLLSWLTIITLVKWLIFGIFIFPLIQYLIVFSAVMLSLFIFEDSDKLIITFIIVLIPFIFYIIKFIIQDMYLKNFKQPALLDEYQYIDQVLSGESDEPWINYDVVALGEAHDNPNSYL